MLRMGVDIGSTTTKAVILDETGAILGAELRPTGHDGQAVAEQVRAALLAAHGFDPSAPDAPAPSAESAESAESAVASGETVAAPPTVATGYGRARAAFADRAITEITCHAKGVGHLHPGTRTLIDVGGQDAKVIRIDATGAVVDFAMNDRCAAGTGAFLDVISGKLGMSLDDLSALDAGAVEAMGGAPAINATCVVFAESEVVGLIARGYDRAAVLLGVLRAAAKRIATLARQAGGEPPYVFCGGVARLEAMRGELERALELPPETPLVRGAHAQFTGAIGAALLA